MKYNKGDEEAKTYKKVSAMMHDDMPKPKSHISLQGDDLPDIKNWEVGKKYSMKLKVKQTGYHSDEYGSHGSFEVEKAEAA